MAVPRSEVENRADDSQFIDARITRRDLLRYAKLVALGVVVEKGSEQFLNVSPLNVLTRGAYGLAQGIVAQHSVDADTTSSRQASVKGQTADAAANSEAALDWDARARKAANEIRNFVVEVGNGPIAHEQASAIVPNVADLFIATQRSPVSRDELIANSYIIPDWDLSKLQKTYPKARFNSATMTDITSRMTQAVGWVDEQGNLFISLPAVNAMPKPTNFMGYQYDAISPEVTCSALRPANQFVGRVAHELGHKESGFQWRPLSERIRESVARQKPGVKYFKGEATAKGFIVMYGEREIFSGLDELSADLRAAATLLKGGLSYSLAYPNPQELYNFSVVLNDSSISLEDLARMQRTSNLEEFIIRLANGARNKNFSNESEAFDYGVSRVILDEHDQHVAMVMPGNGPHTRTLPIGIMARHYPGMDTKKYFYGTEAFKDSKDGCLVFASKVQSSR